jgi:hypothetical protein
LGWPYFASPLSREREDEQFRLEYSLRKAFIREMDFFATLEYCFALNATRWPV